MRQNPTSVFLASLATADLLLLTLCLPLKIAKLFTFSWQVTLCCSFLFVFIKFLNYQFGTFLCKMLAYCDTLSVVCSVLNLTGLSVERWVCFCSCWFHLCCLHHRRSRSRNSRRGMIRSIPFIRPALTPSSSHAHFVLYFPTPNDPSSHNRIVCSYIF